MINYCPVTLIITSYFPANNEGKLVKQVMIDTLYSWREYLEYEGIINIHTADDGSDSEELLPINWFRGYGKEIVWSKSRQERHGVGASLNKGFKKAFETSPLVLYAVGDWALTQSFDLTPWAQLLLEREDVGMVRLGPPHPGIEGRVEAFTSNWQGWAMRLSAKGFAFAHRPALYHKRFIDKYGWFDENCSALECERLYNERWCDSRKHRSYHMYNSDIVLALPHPWQHLNSVELAYIDPKENL
jgi:hypothetical protein